MRSATRALLLVAAVAWAATDGAWAASAVAGTVEGAGSSGWKPMRRHRGMAPPPAAVAASVAASTAAAQRVQGTSSAATATTSAASVPRRERPVDLHRATTTTTTYKPYSQSGVKIPTSSLTKPTKYHYYPHNQHIYLLPECAVQQVCNAVYVRLNFTQPLCACPSRYRDPCSASLNSDDLHTTELITDRGGKALTLVKTCEPVADMRVCRAPRDWSLLALQNIRTGKSHYLVICRCPDDSILEGPTPHDQPTYASVPGIRVFGMTCVQPALGTRRGRPLRFRRAARYPLPPIPWGRVRAAARAVQWDE